MFGEAFHSYYFSAKASLIYLTEPSVVLFIRFGTCLSLARARQEKESDYINAIK